MEDDRKQDNYFKNQQIKGKNEAFIFSIENTPKSVDMGKFLLLYKSNPNNTRKKRMIELCHFAIPKN